MPIWGHLELLCRAIAAEGREEAEQLISRARAKADEVIAAARDAAEKNYQRALQTAKIQAYADAKRCVDSAELEARKRIMAFRETIIREVLEALDRRLQAYRKSPDYEPFLRDALAEALASLPGKNFIVELDHADEELLKSAIGKLKKQNTVQIEIKAAPDCNGGLRVTTRDRRLLYDNSFAARRQRTENDIRREIWSAIFGTHSTAS